VRVVVVNDAYRLFPSAVALYACDSVWWQVHDGCPSFAGEKWTSADEKRGDAVAIAEKYSLRLVKGQRGRTFSLDPERIHYGANSGFQGINLTLLFGADKLALVGFDFREHGRLRHFFGDHPPPLRNRNVAGFPSACETMQIARRDLPPEIEIINCTPDSAINCFPREPLEGVLDRWA
jgi:hypothetical protein